MTAQERPDVALVGLGESSEHALQMVEKIVQEAACPVIALIHARDPDFVKEASKRGIFAYINDADAKDWQSSIDIVLRRFTEYHDLEGAFGRRAVTERAKGILMERHSIDEPAAFELLREHARSTNRKVVDVASAVVDGHRLLRSSRRRLPRREVSRACRWELCSELQSRSGPTYGEGDRSRAARSSPPPRPRHSPVRAVCRARARDA